MVPACFARAGAQPGRLLGAFWDKERSCEPRILLTPQVIPGVKHVNSHLQFTVSLVQGHRDPIF